MSKGSLPDDARKAFVQGRRRFVCRINQGAFQMSFSMPLYGIAEVIEGIEAAGWVLDQVAWTEDRRDHPSAMCVFRRADLPPPGYFAGPQYAAQSQPPQAAPAAGSFPVPPSWGQPQSR
ncbi:hypothetical protein GCM10025734_54270 [Kitasatospora paranensis]